MIRTELQELAHGTLAQQQQFSSCRKKLTIVNEMKDHLRFGIDLESDPVASGLGVAVVSAKEVIP